MRRPEDGAYEQKQGDFCAIAAYPSMSSFFEQVYLIVRQIPRGKVASYGQIAALLGHPRAARTVGWALASLPSDLEPSVPWQRVINAEGRISIRNLRHAAEEQRLLLEEEGVEFDEHGRVDWDRFGWEGLSRIEVEALIAAYERGDN